jgi:hypothetical protein
MASEPIGRSLSAQLLCDAVRNKKRVSLTYHEKERIGEPQCCGISTADNEAVRMYLIKDGSRPLQLFNISQIKSLEVLQEHYSKPGLNYKRDDSAMKEVYCQL